MKAEGRNNWKSVQEEVRHRIAAHIWRPGDLIPNEVDLAKEFGCSRTTVNRALQELADGGLLDRKRKAGTRVAHNPVRRAKLDIPLIRAEIEAKGAVCRHAILTREMRPAPASVQVGMRAEPNEALLHLQALYTADDVPYVFEDRWINPHVVPSVIDADFSVLSPNEWLVRQVPADEGDIAFCATTCSPEVAAKLSCPPGAALFAVDRTTMHAGQIVTSVRLVFHQGYRLRTQL